MAQADDLLAAEKAGVGHWAEHVQAQTAANADRITVDEMNAIFTRTRLAGRDDQDRYDEAVTGYADADGSCAAVAGASQQDAAALARCRDRFDEQQPVLQAGDAAMADWRSHLAAMTRSRTHHLDDAEEIWINAWRAAPPHLRAYENAIATFRDAPDC